MATIPTSGSFTSANVASEFSLSVPYTSQDVANATGVGVPFNSDDLRGLSSVFEAVITSMGQHIVGDQKFGDTIYRGFQHPDFRYSNTTQSFGSVSPTTYKDGSRINTLLYLNGVASSYRFAVRGDHRNNFSSIKFTTNYGTFSVTKNEMDTNTGNGSNSLTVYGYVATKNYTEWSFAEPSNRPASDVTYLKVEVFS